MDYSSQHGEVKIAPNPAYGPVAAIAAKTESQSEEVAAITAKTESHYEEVAAITAKSESQYEEVGPPTDGHSD